MLEYMDSAYPDVKLKINRFTDSIVYDNQEGDWYSRKLLLGRTMSTLFSCTPTEAHNALTEWERNKLFKKWED